jgi:hypothetical protein
MGIFNRKINLTFLLVIFLFSLFFFPLIKAETNLTTCQNLAGSEIVYKLTNDVYGAGDCFNITSSNGLIGSNLTLDCNNYDVYYGDNASGSGFKNVVWAPRKNITIKNCHFIHRNASVNNSYGVELASVDGVTMLNNNFTFNGSGDRGIYLHDSDRYPVAAYNFQINNTRIYSRSYGGIGVYINEGTANGSINNIDLDMIGDGDGSLIGFSGTYTTVRNLTATASGEMHGLVFWDDNTGYNTVDGCDLVLSLDGDDAGVLFYTSAVGNVIKNCGIYVTNNDDNYAVKWWGGAGNITDNHFISTILSTIGRPDNNSTWISVYLPSNRINYNYYTNVTFSPSPLENYWFYSSDQNENYWMGYIADIYVNDTEGNPVSGANVTIKFSDGTLWRTGLTDSNGNFVDQEVPWQKINHTESPWRENRYNYSNFNFSATKTLQGMDYEIKNMTQNWVGSSKIVLTLDSIGPSNITLVAPTNNYYRNNDSGFSFLCNLTGDSLTNATLWGNWSGTWAANKTDTLSGSQDLAQFIFAANEIQEGPYKWTCYGCDSTGCRFANTNYTLQNDYTKPSIWLWRPDQGSIQDDGNITFQLKCYDGYSGPGTLELYGNWSEPVEDPKASNATPINNEWWNVNQTITANGVYSWYGVCYDEAGNYKTSPEKWFIVDNTTTRVTGCMNITSPGNYVLQNDILNTSQIICMNITASNVTFDGNYYKIEGQTIYYQMLISLGPNLRNIEIKRTNFSKGEDHIVNYYGENVSNLTIRDNEFYSSLDEAIQIYGNISNIIVYNNSFYSVQNAIVSDGGNVTNLSVLNNFGYFVSGTGYFIYTGANYSWISLKNNILIGRPFIWVPAISRNFEIRNNSIINSSIIFPAISFEMTNNVTIDENNFSGSRDIVISLYKTNNSIVNNNRIINVSETGIYGSQAWNMTITNNFLENSAQLYGIWLNPAQNIQILNNSIINYTTGILVSTAVNVTIDRNNISKSTQYAIQFSGTNNNVTIKNNRVFDSGVAFYTFGANSNNSNIYDNYFYNSTGYGSWVGSGVDIVKTSSNNFSLFNNNKFGILHPTNISLKHLPNLIDLNIGALEINLTNPVAKLNIDKYINITKVSGDNWLLLNFSYSTGDLQGRDEATLLMYKYNSTGWYGPTSFTSSYGVDTTNNIVWANITSFDGIFAPMINEEIPAPTCGYLDINNSEYILNQSLSASSTCFTLQADNVTLNCRGYNITYGVKGTLAGNAVLDNEGHINFTIKNCGVITGNNTAYSDGLNFTGTTESTIFNNSFRINGTGSSGINIDGSVGGAETINISYNNISIQNPDSSYGIIISSGQDNTITRNKIYSNASSGGAFFCINCQDGVYYSNNYYTNRTSNYDFSSILTGSGTIIRNFFNNPTGSNYEEINASFNSVSPSGVFIDYRDSPATDPTGFVNVSKYLYITGYQNMDFFWFYNLTIDGCGPELTAINCGWTTDKTTCNTCGGCNYIFGSCGGVIDCSIFNGQQTECEAIDPVCRWTPGPDTCDLNLGCPGADETTCEYIQNNGWGCTMTGTCQNTIPPLICSDLSNETSCSTECGGSFGCSWANGTNESNLELLRYNGGAWQQVNSTVDTVNNFIFSDMVYSTHGFGTFAIMEGNGPAGSTNAPENLSIYLREDNFTTKINWSVVSGCDGYYIYWGDNLTEILQLDPGRDIYEQVVLSGENNNSYNDTTANESIRRFYRVASYTNGGLNKNISHVNETVGKYTITIIPGEMMFSMPLNESDSIEHFMPSMVHNPDNPPTVYTYEPGVGWILDYYWIDGWVKEFNNLETEKGYWTFDFGYDKNITNLKKIVFGSVNTTINQGEGTAGWMSITTGEQIDYVIPNPVENPDNPPTVYTYEPGVGWIFNYYFSGSWVKDRGFNTFEPTYGYWTLDFQSMDNLNYTANPY